MTPTEIAQVLAKAAAFDRRTVGESDIVVWGEALIGIELDEAMRAVSHHNRVSTNWLKPGHIVDIVRDMRAAARRGSSDALALTTYGWNNPRPEQAELNTRGRQMCNAVLGGQPHPLDVPTQLLRVVIPRGATA